MPFACRIRWMTLFYPLFIFILVAFEPGVGSAHAQVQPQNPQATTNVLILNAFESNI